MFLLEYLDGDVRLFATDFLAGFFGGDFFEGVLDGVLVFFFIEGVFVSAFLFDFVADFSSAHLR